MATIASLTVALRANTAAFDNALSGSAERALGFTRTLKSSMDELSRSADRYARPQSASELEQSELALYKSIAETKTQIERTALNERLQAMEAAAEREWQIDQQRITQEMQLYRDHVDLEERYYAATHSGLQVMLRQHDNYYATLRAKHAGNAAMLSRIDKTYAAERARIIQTSSQVNYESLMRAQTSIMLLGRGFGATGEQAMAFKMALTMVAEAGDMASKGGLSRMADSAKQVFRSVTSLGPALLTGAGAAGVLAAGFLWAADGAKRSKQTMDSLNEGLESFRSAQRGYREAFNPSVSSPGLDKTLQQMEALKKKASEMQNQEFDFGFNWGSDELEQNAERQARNQADLIYEQVEKLQQLADQHREVAEIEQQRSDWEKRTRASSWSGQLQSIDYLQQQADWYQKIADKNDQLYRQTGAKSFWEGQQEALAKVMQYHEQILDKQEEEARKQQQQAKGISDIAEGMKRTLAGFSGETSSFEWADLEKQLRQYEATAEQIREIKDLWQQSKEAEAAAAVNDQLSEMNLQLAVINGSMTELDAAMARLKIPNATVEQLEQIRAVMQQIEDARKEQQRKEGLMEEGQRIFEQTRTPLEQYEAQITRLNELLDAGAINWDTYGRAVKQARDKLESQMNQDKPSATSRGTFNASAILSLQSGGNTAADRTAKATERMEKHTKELVRKANQGGLVFG